jgi:hypothetical protein
MTDVKDKKPRVLYLDVDDTVLVWTNEVHGYAAPKAAEFLHWALEHFEVRWLTMWCPSGKLEENQTQELSYRFNYKVDSSVFAGITNPRSFINSKCEGIDFEDPRPWVWVEDHLMPKEKYELENRNVADNFYSTHVTHNRVMLQSTWKKLAERFDLPHPVKYPYSTELDMPIQLINVDDIIEHFRIKRNGSIIVPAGLTENG